MSDTAGTGTETTNEPQGSEVTGTETETTETPTVDDLLAQVEEWKGHARKHEDRAKAAADAVKELADLKRAQMTDAEKAEADRAEREGEFTTLKTERDEAVAALARYKVATEFGLSAEDAEALSSITDEATLRSLAERLSGRSTGTRPNPAQGKSKAKAVTPAEAFADALSDLF